MTLILLIASWFQLSGVHILGPSSTYMPGDGYNRGILSCGGKFTHQQEHVALRGWRRYGCGSQVLIVIPSTLSAGWTTVRDAGPFGIIKGKQWKCWPKLKPPDGWQWRGVVDISVGLWKKLGRPRFLSKAYLWVLPKHEVRSWRALVRGLWLPRTDPAGGGHAVAVR